MYVGLKQPRGDGERYVTPARAAAKETTTRLDLLLLLDFPPLLDVLLLLVKHMIVIWCHDLMDHSQIMLSVTKGITCRALTFQYALYILRNEQLNFSNNFNSFLFQLRHRAVQDILSLKMGTVWLANYVTEKSLLTFDHQNRAKIPNKFSFVIVARRWRLVSSLCQLCSRRNI